MFRYALILLLFSFTVSFANLLEIRDLKCDVKETQYLNGDTKKREYFIEYIAPDYLRKEMIFPKVNSGEIYQYEKGEGYSYLPIFDEVVKLKQNELNSFLAIIRLIQTKVENNKRLKSLYYNRKSVEIPYQDGYSIKILKYGEVSKYLLPVEFDIVEKSKIVLKIKLSKILVNSSLKRKGLKDGVHKN